MPALILGIPLYGFARGVPVYRTFVEGAEEGLNVAARILPYLVAIMFATSLFRASGAMDVLVAAFRLLTAVGVPAEVIPLLFLKPISGAASLSYTIDLMNRLGPDSFPAFLACVSQASFDTTFYVVSLYFGSIGVRNTRHTIPVALLGDVTGFIVALLVSRRLFPL
ncbi:MAG: spore maturation protein [Firmicutes bacterium]|nr:spore maturation protein [Bacillota bacterium]